jgi:hypothetical protein
VNKAAPPTVKRILSRTDSYGNILETIDLDAAGLSPEERQRLLARVFRQGMMRLGYKNLAE